MPPSITLLPLAYLNFDNNKLRHIPKSIVQGGVQSILGHLKDLLKGSEPCYRMRLIIAGQENVIFHYFFLKISQNCIDNFSGWKNYIEPMSET